MAVWLQQRTRHARKFWEQCSTPQRMLIWFLVAVLVAVGGWWILHSRAELRPLLAGRALRPDELQRMQMALGQAGLNEFVVTDDSILVPRQSLDKYLKAIAKAGAIPEDLACNGNDTPELNLLMTRQQQEAVLLHRKKKELSGLIRKLPFVEQAWVEIDTTSGATAFQRPRMTCVVSIQPQAHTLLSREQIHSVRRIATGAVAGLEADQVVVVDMQAGLALSHDGKSSVEQAEIDLIAQQLRDDRELEQAITEDLRADYGAVAVAVSSRGWDRASAERPAGFQVTAMLPQGIVGTSGRALATSSSSESQVANLTWKRKIRVEIPAASLPQRAVQGKGSRSVTTNLAEFKSDLKKRVLAFMASRNPALPGAEIDVEVLPPTNGEHGVNPLGWVQTLQGRYPGAVIAAGSGILLCLFLLLSTRRKPAHRATSAAAQPGPASAPTDESVRQSIDRLIQNDPAVVAQVLQDWIRKAS